MTNVVGSSHCPACQSLEIKESFELETFPYGELGAEISVEVPVIRCENCCFVYTDQRAEQARHAAICLHNGLLSPSEIRHIRKVILKMSREVLHAAYGLSSASVERWENGKLFQGEAADTLFRALQDPEMARKLDRRDARLDKPLEISEHGNVIWASFPSLTRRPGHAEDALKRSKDFSLRIQAG